LPAERGITRLESCADAAIIGRITLIRVDHDPIAGVREISIVVRGAGVPLRAAATIAFRSLVDL
jgi:hypothetical protein